MNIKTYAAQYGVSTDIPEGQTYTRELGTELHNKFYSFIVNAMGYEDVKACIPFTLEQIKNSNDPHLNDLAMSKWDMAGGFRCPNGQSPIVVQSRLRSLYKRIGVTAFSPSTSVCILKCAARMWASEQEVL